MCREKSAVLLGLLACLCFQVALSSTRNQNLLSEPPLVLAQPRAAEIKSDSSHSYPLTLAAGTYARVIVEPQGTPLEIALLASDGTVLFHADDPRDGLTTLSIVAEHAAVFRLRVSAASAGRYHLTLAETRAATTREQEAFAARRLYQEAVQLQRRRDSASLRQAVEKCQQAAALFQDAAENARASGPLNLAGLSYETLGEYALARRAYEQALALQRRYADRLAEAETSKNLGRLFSNGGEYQRALDCFDQAYQLARAVGAESVMVASLDLLGITYNRLGEFEKARVAYQQMLDKAQAVQPAARRTAAERHSYEALALNGLGIVAVARGEHQRGVAYLTQALQKLPPDHPDPLLETMLLGNLGGAYRRMEAWPQALEHAARALQQYRALGNRRGEANMQTVLGDSYARLGRNAEARVALTQALALTTTLGLHRERALIHGSLARLARAEGQLAEALVHSEQALQVIEKQQTPLVSPNLRATFHASRHHAYEVYLDLLMRRHEQAPAGGYAATAFHASERAHARALLGLLAESSAPLLATADPQLAAREQALQHQIEAQTNGSLPGQQTGSAADELTMLLAELDVVQSQIRQRHPRYGALTQPAPLTMADVQQQVLEADMLLLEYHLGTDRSYLFAVGKTSFHSFALPPRATIEPAARRLHELLTAFSHPPDFSSLQEKRAWQQTQAQAQQAAAARLSQWLLAPAQALFNGQRLLIVPDGALHYVPFAALPEPELRVSSSAFRGSSRVPENSKLKTRNSQPLIAHHEILTLPSASTLAVLRREWMNRQAAPRTLAIFADPVFEKHDGRVSPAVAKTRRSPRPPQMKALVFGAAPETRGGARLPASRQEAEAIAALVPPAECQLAVDFSASRAAVLHSALQQYRYVHFATHGVLNNAQPELSGLVFSQVDAAGQEQNGFLRALDVFQLQLNAELVALSGCQTALGKEVNGEGLIGLTRGFMYAGARRVLASLWQVNDGATAELMQRFYQGLLGKQKLAPAAALRAAQLDMWRNPRWQSPYYWAAFTLQGEW